MRVYADEPQAPPRREQHHAEGLSPAPPGNAVAQLLAQAARHYQAGQLREASQLSR
jgi:hypothetical protein